MSEEIENRSSEELPRIEKAKIRYTIAVLLELSNLEVCCNLPDDFDPLILSELDGECDCTTEQKQISSPSSLLDDSFPISRVERWEGPLLLASKNSYLQGNFSPEITDVVRQPLLQESGYNAGAGILGPEIQKSVLSQLRKSGNPYRPPHKKTPQSSGASSELGNESSESSSKMLQPLSASYELGKDSSRSSSVSATENMQTEPVDSIKESDSFGNGVDLADIENSPVESAASCDTNDGSGMLSVNKAVELGVIEDNEPTFDDYWAEILEIIHLEQELKLAPIPFNDGTSDTEAEISLPNEDSLRRTGHSKLCENLDFFNLVPTCSEAGFNLPDEDSLITIEDLIAPHILCQLNKSPREADKVNGTQGKLHSQLSYLQSSPNMFTPEKPYLHRGKENKSSLTKFKKPIFIHPTATPDCYACSYFHHQPFLETTPTKTNTNGSLVQYSVLDQPKVLSPQQIQLLIGAKCPNPIKPSEKTICQGSGKSYAAALNRAVKERSSDQKLSGRLYADAVLCRIHQPGIRSSPRRSPI